MYVGYREAAVGEHVRATRVGLCEAPLVGQAEAKFVRQFPIAVDQESWPAHCQSPILRVRSLRFTFRF